MGTYETRGVLAGAYAKSLRERNRLTHTLSITEAGVESMATLCGKIPARHLADEYASDINAPPTCPMCLRYDPRFARGNPPVRQKICRRCAQSKRVPAARCESCGVVKCQHYLTSSKPPICTACVRQNPAKPRGGRLLTERVLDITYIHAESAGRTPYRHKFETPVELYCMPDGSLRIVSPNGRRLWDSFIVGDDA